MLKSINPATEQIINSFETMKLSTIDSLINSVSTAYEKWSRTDFNLRSKLIQNASDVLKAEKESYAKLMTEEMGKPIIQSRAEVEKCAWVCEYYAENGERFLSDEIVRTDASKSFVTFQPLGVILAIMPWNFPFWQVFRFASPSLMAGNSAILKHASNVSGCAMAIEDIFVKAGFPENIFRSILLPSSEMESVIKNDKVKAISLTGSVPAGKSVAKTAGSALKKTVMELGGSDPYLILEDADLDLAAEACVTSRLINGGQSCIAAKRFIVVDSIYNQFENLFVEKMKSKRIGDPFNEENDLGPQASMQLRDELHNQVRESIKLGAKLLLGGEIPLTKGAYYPPTVLSEVEKGMPVYDEEIFGPVAALIKAKDENEAIRIANDTIFGLGAAVFTSDEIKGEKIAKEKLNAGCCFVNDFVKSDPRLPFGGIKKSGYGRELSFFGIREFVNIKSVYVR